MGFGEKNLYGGSSFSHITKKIGENDVIWMKLKKILKNIKGIEIKGSKDIDITGISCDSKLVFPGNLFIALCGKTYDGAKFIPEAISAGASAIVTDMYDPFIDKKIAQVIHDDVSEIQADIALSYYNNPSNQLLMVGVSGTNGKTTTSYLIKHILENILHSPCGLIGTVEYVVGQHRHFASRTTPDCITNQKLLREMVNTFVQRKMDSYIVIFTVAVFLVTIFLVLYSNL